MRALRLFDNYPTLQFDAHKNTIKAGDAAGSVKYSLTDINGQPFKGARGVKTSLFTSTGKYIDATKYAKLNKDNNEITVTPD